jgi:hypothetical protein
MTADLVFGIFLAATLGIHLFGFILRPRSSLSKILVLLQLQDQVSQARKLAGPRILTEKGQETLKSELGVFSCVSLSSPADS